MKSILARIFTFLLIVLLSFSSLAILKVKAQISETIIIQPDGRIEGTTKIEQQDNTYTLTDNITSGIQIQKSNIRTLCNLQNH